MKAAAVVLSLLSWTIATPARAQDPGIEEQLPSYRVEVLIFQMPGASRRPEDPGTPPLPPEPELPVFDLLQDGTDDPVAVEEPTRDEIAVADEVSPDPASFFFEPVEREDLLGMAGKLGRRTGYRVLFHEAWRQPGFPRNDSMTLDLDTVGRLRNRIEYEEALAQGLRPPAPEPDPAPGLPQDAQAADGPPPAETLTATVRLWRGRYLHLDIETALTRDTLAMRLSESRRMRSGELHYFDSPNIGAIAVIVPYEESPAEGEAEPAPALSNVPAS